MIQRFFLFLLCCLSYSSYASLKTEALQPFLQATASQKPKGPKSKDNALQVDRISPKEVEGAKKLIRAMGWQAHVQSIVTIFDNARFRPEIKFLVLNYLEQEKYGLFNKIEVGNVHSWAEYYYPVQELVFTDDRMQLAAIFDCCTQEEYQEKKKKKPQYCGSGLQWYWINKQRAGNAFEDNDPIEGVIKAERFEETILDGPIRLRRGNPSFTYNYDLRGHRIQDPTPVTISDDGLLKAQVENGRLGIGGKFIESVPRKEYPNKVLVDERFEAQEIHISVWLNMTKFLRIILLAPKILEKANNSCVIL